MSEYTISKVNIDDKRANSQINELLIAEGIRRDRNLDYTCAIYDHTYDVIATGSCFGNTLRCMAVSSTHQGEGLMNIIVSHLMEYQFTKGNFHIFLYTKCNSSKFFSSLGFYEIQRIDDKLVFMENKRTGFKDYLSSLTTDNSIYPNQDRQLPKDPLAAAIVMNANPFTNGHLYLVEKACQNHDLVHLFIVSEDASLVPFSIRKKLIIEGTSHLKNIIYHESGPYIISSSTFPSYFQKDERSVIEGHALLDVSIFASIARHLNIDSRFVGDEPASVVTNIYNNIMLEQLPLYGIKCIIIPRKKLHSDAISASTVRAAIHDSDWDTLESLVPVTTFNYFKSEAAIPVINRIQAASDVIHY